MRGAIVRVPPPKLLHGRVTGQAYYAVRQEVDRLGIGKLGIGKVYDNCGFLVGQNPDAVLAPDVAVVGTARLGQIEAAEAADRYPALAPDLVIEVVSPSDTARGTQDKVLTYLAAGVRLVWVVAPRGRTVTVWAPDRTARIVGGDEILDGGDVLPGLRLTTADLVR